LRDSDLPISEVTTANEVIQVLAATSSLGLDHGVLLNVPIPEEAALDSEVIHELIRSSIIELEDKGITGQDVTPFILERLAKETEGASVPANMALLENNASVACTIAKLL
jgi:pseudouridine-5'-phosphate glycosidase